MQLRIGVFNIYIYIHIYIYIYTCNICTYNYWGSSLGGVGDSQALCLTIQPRNFLGPLE